MQESWRHIKRKGGSPVTQIYGTIGPACKNKEVLSEMFALGMTGLRLNLSHTTLQEAAGAIADIQSAAASAGLKPELLIDMQGPELRIGKLAQPLALENGTAVSFCPAGPESAALSAEAIPLPELVLDALRPGQELLLDDGKLLLVADTPHSGRVLRGGLLRGGKSIALPGCSLRPPTMTVQDQKHIREASRYGVTGIMQPFVRDAEDLKLLRDALDAAGSTDIRIFAKIENLSGVEHLESFFPLADEIVIARGDLGNALPLWKLPSLQQRIAAACRSASVPFMVVTQMLASMEQSAVPTRAEVNDIYHAILDGAASVMVTGETAVGAYPVEVIRYLVNTVRQAERDLKSC